MLIDVRRTFGQLIGKQIDQVLHEISLCHEEVLADVSAVAFQLVLSEEDVQELLVSLFVCRLDPLLQLVNI